MVLRSVLFCDEQTPLIQPINHVEISYIHNTSCHELLLINLFRRLLFLSLIIATCSAAVTFYLSARRKKKEKIGGIGRYTSAFLTIHVPKGEHIRCCYIHCASMGLTSTAARRTASRLLFSLAGIATLSSNGRFFAVRPFNTKEEH